MAHATGLDTDADMASRRIDQRHFGQLQLAFAHRLKLPGMSKRFFMICFLLLLSRTAEAGVRSVAHIRQRERSAKALPSPPPTLSRGG